MDVLPADYAPPQHNQGICTVRTRCGEKLAATNPFAQARESFGGPSSFGIGRRRMATVAAEFWGHGGGITEPPGQKGPITACPGTWECATSFGLACESQSCVKCY